MKQAKFCVLILYFLKSISCNQNETGENGLEIVAGTINDHNTTSNVLSGYYTPSTTKCTTTTPRPITRSTTKCTSTTTERPATKPTTKCTSTTPKPSSKSTTKCPSTSASRPIYTSTHKPPNKRRIAAYYAQFDKCEGHFSRIQLDIIDEKYEWKCNHYWIHDINVTANGYINNVRHCINATSDQIVKDSNGTEKYNSMGMVLSGECRGAHLIVQTDLHVDKGDCDTGVTELYSKTRSALVALKGLCETTCKGTMWLHYWPGKKIKQ